MVAILHLRNILNMSFCCLSMGIMHGQIGKKDSEQRIPLRTHAETHGGRGATDNPPKFCQGAKTNIIGFMSMLIMSP